MVYRASTVQKWQKCHKHISSCLRTDVNTTAILCAKVFGWHFRDSNQNWLVAISTEFEKIVSNKRKVQSNIFAISTQVNRTSPTH